MAQLGRREFLRAAAAGAASFGYSGAAQAAASKPNIVLVVGDDMTYTDSGCYGNPEVKTPNIDRLASEGMRFTRCFTATAMCSPTRQMIYTGKYPVKNGAYPNHAVVREGTKSVVHYLNALGYRVGIAGKRHFGPPEAFPFETVSNNGLEFSKFEEFINRDKSQPFCLIVTSNEPHSPWNKGDAAPYDPAKLTIPPHLVDTAEMRATLAKYYAEITYLDQELGRTLEFVRKSGQESNTLVMFTSEQGASFAHCKWTLYDTGMRVQLIARWPGRIKAGSTANAMVQYCDLLPTWIDAASGKPAEDLDGRSFLPVLLGKIDHHREHVYGVHTTRGIIGASECYPIRAIRDEHYKFIWNLNSASPFKNIVTRDGGQHFNSWREKARTDLDAADKVRMYEYRPAEELYDLREDPYELRNLAGDPKLRPVMEALRKRLEAWMIEQGDEGIATEMEAEKHQARNQRAG